MRILCFFLIIQFTYAQIGFGTSYLKNSRLCQKWNCINVKLGLSDELPPREHYTVVLKGLLPEAWQHVVETTLDGCYGNRTRRYTNTCPGQALTHCVIDQLIANCPETNIRMRDGCSPVSSLAGLNYMFSQSQYSNLENNLSQDRRPDWFLKNYFSGQCCDLPNIFDLSTLTQCGFREIMHTYIHAPQMKTVSFVPHGFNFTFSTVSSRVYVNDSATVRSTPKHDKEGVQVNIVNLNDISTTAGTKIEEDYEDPLNCCDLSGFIKQSWREECAFEVSWKGQDRLVVDNHTIQNNTEVPLTSTTARSTVASKDMFLTPHTCEKETCIFRQLNIISETGVLDHEAYLKFLDNFTAAFPSWTKAKARVITTCMGKPLTEYEADCEINKILACTFDVLTENCPFKLRDGLCRHQRNQIHADICQISVSKFRPRHRRPPCPIPNFVDQAILSSCNVTHIALTQNLPQVHIATRPRKSSISTRYMCKNLSPSTACLLNKMGVLNRYGFLDYFKMKDSIRQFTAKQDEWNSSQEVYLSAFVNMPLYRDYCNSPKKFLNVLDSMLLTCPASKRNTTPKCTKLFNDMESIMPDARAKINEIIQHFHHVFMPQESISIKRPVLRPKHFKKVIKNPPYNFGLLDSHMAPPIKVIDVKPEVKRPLIVLPVYLRLPNDKLVRIRPIQNDGIWRDQPFWLHNQIAQAHIPSTTPTIFNTYVSPTNKTKI